MDIVMNVAGDRDLGHGREAHHEQWRRNIDVNLMGPIHVIECFLPPMIAAAAAGIWSTSPRPRGCSACPGTRLQRQQVRAARRLRGAALRPAPARIGVSLVCPGAVDTRWSSTRRHRGRRREHPTMRKRARFPARAVTPERGAERIIRGDRAQPLPGLHLARHPGRALVPAPFRAALHARDAPRQRPVHGDRASALMTTGMTPLPRGRHGLSREQVEASQRLRLMRAMAEVMAEKGYARTSVADILRRARVSRETFYELFDSKEDCFMSAFEQAYAHILDGGHADRRRDAAPGRASDSRASFAITWRPSPPSPTIAPGVPDRGLCRRPTGDRRVASSCSPGSPARSPSSPATPRQDRFAVEALLAAIVGLVDRPAGGWRRRRPARPPSTGGGAGRSARFDLGHQSGYPSLR